MKLVASLLVILTLSGCTSRTPFGECKGLADQKDPKLTYDLSVINLVVGAVFVETLVVPIVVVTKELECPTGNKF